MDNRSAPWSPSSTSRVASSSDPDSENSETENSEAVNPEAVNSETGAESAESQDEAAATGSASDGEPVSPIGDESENTSVLDDGTSTGRHAKDDSYEPIGSTLGTDYGDADMTASEDAGNGALSGEVLEEVVVVESAGSADDGASGAVVDEVLVVETADSAGDRTPGAANGYGTAAASTSPDAGDSAAEWSEIKALFVDDPAASVQRASALVERSVEGFMSSLRRRNESLGDWQEGDASGTEELRKALRGYRGLFDQIEQLSGQFPSGGVIAVGTTPDAESAASGRI